MSAPSGKNISGTNLEHARSHNRRAVLEAVRMGGALSRADIARRTSLTIQTISNIVVELEAKGLLLAGAIVRNPKGQPSIPYSINPEGGWSAGFHIARHSIMGVLTDLTGRVVSQVEEFVEPKTPDESAPIVSRLLADTLKTACVDARKLIGIGIALPARFDIGPLTTAGPTGLPGWNDVEARARFSAGIGIPTFIENDAVAAAIGERNYGVARGVESFVLLYLEDGLGAGLFLNGNVFKGALSNAGEIGHMIVEPNGRACPCGNRGCLERYVSLRAALECLSANTPGEAAINTASLDLMPVGRLQKWLDEAGPRLSTAINIIETVLDPETIIIGGLASKPILEALIKSAMPFPVSASARPNRNIARVIAGSAGRHATALGAAALPIFDKMNPRFDVLLKT
jgi:predicted NBD/HSP70 family sugar kinase